MTRETALQMAHDLIMGYNQIDRIAAALLAASEAADERIALEVTTERERCIEEFQDGMAVVFDGTVVPEHILTGTNEVIDKVRLGPSSALADFERKARLEEARLWRRECVEDCKDESDLMRWANHRVYKLTTGEPL